MKYKKSIAIALCVGIISSSFSGIISYAAYNSNKESNSAYNKAAEQSISDMLPDIYDQDITANSNVVLPNNEDILYKGTLIQYNTEDFYNIDQEELTSLLEHGYTIQEIFEADEFGNELFIDPKELLEMKNDTKKTLQELKDGIIKERTDNATNHIKSMYKNEYKKLLKEGLKEDEVLSLLMYADANELQITDALIKEYKSKGATLFSNKSKKVLSEEIKMQYGISDKDAKKLNDEIIKMIESVSKETGKSVKDLINSYLKNIK